MSLTKLLSNYARYNEWANERLITWLNTKPETDFYKEVASSYPSIVLTMNHILAVQEFWLSIVAKTEIEKPRYIIKDPEHNEVFSTLTAQSKALADFVSGLSEAELQEEIHVKTPWFEGILPGYEFIQHLLNHSTYHRGQAVTIGRNLGYTDAPMTDYNYYNIMLQTQAV